MLGYREAYSKYDNNGTTREREREREREIHFDIYAGAPLNGYPYDNDRVVYVYMFLPVTTCI